MTNQSQPLENQAVVGEQKERKRCAFDEANAGCKIGTIQYSKQVDELWAAELRDFGDGYVRRINWYSHCPICRCEVPRYEFERLFVNEQLPNQKPTIAGRRVL